MSRRGFDCARMRCQGHGDVAKSRPQPTGPMCIAWRANPLKFTACAVFIRTVSGAARDLRCVPANRQRNLFARCNSPAHSPRPMLRSLLWSLALLAALVVVGWNFAAPARQPQVAGYVWRRTTKGWEQVPQWRPPERTEEPWIHPLLVASLQLSLSLLALETLPTGNGQEPRGR